MSPENLPIDTGAEPAQAVDSFSTRHTKIILSAVLLILLIGVGTLYSNLKNISGVQAPAAPSGNIYLGLAPGNSSNPSIYAYDLARGNLSPVSLITPNANSVSISSDGNLLSFVGWKEDNISHVFVLDIFKNTSYQVTSDSPKLPRAPRWSPDNRQVAFTASTAQTPDFRDLDSWGAYVSSLRGETIFIAPGAYPEWLTEERGLFLRSDGVYTFDLKSKKIGLVLPMLNSKAAFNMRLAVSPDKTKLAWSAPSIGKVYVYAIRSLESSFDTLSLEKTLEINSHSFWVVFSPNSNYLATQEVDWDKIYTDDPKPRIVIFNTEGERVRQIDLPGYNQQTMFLSEWK
ncbi:MAG: hypothetical protein AAB597_02660 [Patescibacteria group bacterium]